MSVLEAFSCFWSRRSNSGSSFYVILLCVALVPGLMVSGCDGESGSPDSGPTADTMISDTPTDTEPVDPCRNGVMDGDESDVDCGGSCAVKCGAGLSCRTADDCASRSCSDSMACLPSSCSDDILNGNETDVDCGGSRCRGCGLGAVCGVAEDCANGQCVDNLCVSESCFNSVQDSTESDVDCGGLCKSCDSGLSCFVDSDCLTGACVEGLCAAQTCNDRQQNGDETDVDCGGSCGKCATTLSCNTAADCFSGNCESGSCGTGYDSCYSALVADPTLRSGVYELMVGDVPMPQKFYCDMDTDGGGWTLVSSSLNSPTNDEAKTNTEGLESLYPSSPNPGIFSGFRGVSSLSDIRFACRLGTDPSKMEVDISFYENTWYDIVTSGSDSDSCFSVAGTPLGNTDRRDNLALAFFSENENRENNVSMVGERSCDDTDSFGVDLNNAGVRATTQTSWGRGDGAIRCGDSTGLVGSSFFVFHRPNLCSNGVRDTTETDVDCGGTCGPCPDGSMCSVAADCVGGGCDSGTCVSCADGQQNADETDIDCGGSVCQPCVGGDSCAADNDCASGECEPSSMECTEAPATCLEILSSDPASLSGTYTIIDKNLQPVQVYCDMTTDGGGWTMVSNSYGVSPESVGIQADANLSTINPSSPFEGVFGALNSPGTFGDVRFSCKEDAANSNYTVDLVFYETDAYRQMSQSTEALGCFFTGSGEAAPRRKNLLTGDELADGTGYESSGGTMEGEDNCGDSGDFTVDFDEGGMDRDSATDWGKDDGRDLCGENATIASSTWTVWFREGSQCSNGVFDGSESDVDCGGFCRPCMSGASCNTFEDCQSRHCLNGICQ